MIAQLIYARFIAQNEEKYNRTVYFSNFNLLLIHTLALISIVTILARADKISILYTALTTIHTRDGVTKAGCNSVRKLTHIFFLNILKKEVSDCWSFGKGYVVEGTSEGIYVFEPVLPHRCNIQTHRETNVPIVSAHFERKQPLKVFQ